MKFDAAKAAEPLEFNFAPYSEEKGTVPEPTDDQVATFYAALAKQLENALPADRLEGVDMTDPVAVGTLFMSLDADENRSLYDHLLTIHADVCGGKPSRDALEALPYRLRRVFYGMVQGWLRPEASRPATDE